MAKTADDNLDFNYMRVASEVLDIITKPYFDKNSVILLNAGLHYLESTNFSNYQKTIGSIIRLFEETKMVKRANGNPLFPGEMIWRTTTALNKQKLDAKHIQARRFLTYQVWNMYVFLLLLDNLLLFTFFRLSLSSTALTNKASLMSLPNSRYLRYLNTCDQFRVFPCLSILLT